jgi:hypothetical protein
LQTQLSAFSFQLPANIAPVCVGTHVGIQQPAYNSVLLAEALSAHLASEEAES